MGQRQKDWARRERVRLTFALGGRCEACGTTDDLQFDCKEPCGDDHHKMEFSQRMCFYRAQHKAKNLQLLCGYHNAVKSRIDKQRLRKAA